MAQDVYFTSNPAEFTQVEGLYVVEKDPPGFIQGADLGATGIAGICVRGPSTVQWISSTARFLEVYGGRDRGSGGALVGEVWRSLLNKRFGSLYIRRVIATDADTGHVHVEEGVDGAGTEVLKVAASSPGDWAADVGWKVEDASDGDANHFNLVVRYLGETVTYENLNIKTASDDNLAEVIGDDVANWVTVTKLADGRPANNSTVTETDFVAARDADDFVQIAAIGAAYTTNVGDDGTAVSADYISAITDLAYTPGPYCCFVAGASVDQNALNGTLVTLAPLVADKAFLTWSGTHGQVVATESANKGTDITTASGRIWWCFNSAYTLDPETGLEIQVPPHEWMAGICSQTDVDVHPGDRANAQYCAGIRRLANETLTRADLVALRAAGISTLEKLPDGAFLFRSAVVTDTTTGKTEIARRRSADYLILSASDRLRYYVKSKNTLENRAQMAGELVAFSNALKDASRIIEDFAIDQSMNTDASRGQGIEKIRWDVRLIGHMLHLILESTIGTTVTIEES